VLFLFPSKFRLFDLLSRMPLLRCAFPELRAPTCSIVFVVFVFA
jgi:hypothetical protein